MENKAEAKNLKTMIITKSTTVAFTGYRASKILALGQDPKDLQTQIIDQLTPIIETLYSHGYRTFLCGMSDGFDLWAAMAVVVAKGRHKDINLIAATPFQGQERSYSQVDKTLYSYILKSLPLPSNNLSNQHNRVIFKKKRLYAGKLLTYNRLL